MLEMVPTIWPISLDRSPSLAHDLGRGIDSLFDLAHLADGFVDRRAALDSLVRRCFGLVGHGSGIGSDFFNPGRHFGHDGGRIVGRIHLLSFGAAGHGLDRDTATCLRQPGRTVRRWR